MADASVGEVDTTLDGKEVTLRCSLDAAKRVNAGGGIANAKDRLGRGDLDVYVLIVAAGLGKKPAEVESAVYRTGMVNLVEPLVTFLEYLVNGGRPAAPSGDEKTGEA